MSYVEKLIIKYKDQNNQTVTEERDIRDAETAAEVSELKSQINNIENNSFAEELKTATLSSDNLRLNESDGLCSVDYNYRLVRYTVTAGNVVKIVSTDRFQFQTELTVPTSGTNNRVGDTYGSGTYFLEVPSTATYLIFSTLKTDTPEVYDTGTPNKRLAALNDDVGELQAQNIVIPDIYSISGFTLKGDDGTEYEDSNSSCTDFIQIKTGDKIAYHLKAGNSRSALHLYDRSKNSVSQIASGAGGNTFVDGTYTAVSDGYIRSSILNNSSEMPYFYFEDKVPENVKHHVEEVKDTVDSSIASVNSDLKALATSPMLIVCPDIFSVDNTVITSTGSEYTVNNGKATDYIPIKTGDKIVYHIRTGNERAVLYFYDTSKEPSALIQAQDDSTYKEGTYTAVADGYIRASVGKSFLENSYFYFDGVIQETTKKKIETDKAELIASIQVVDEKAKRIDVDPAFLRLPDAFSIDGIALKADGTESSATNYTSTDFIPLKTGEKVIYRIRSGNGRSALYFYTTDKSPSAQIAAGAGEYVSGEYTAVVDGYIRASALTSYKSGSYFYVENRLIENVKRLFEKRTKKLMICRMRMISRIPILDM